ncbi:hypothetical protein [Niveibacterium sp. COAC-50]|uniref:hypothetical protein n=1 Tax=Niveibacterium sp. COAC-50 TaxID=2729384 RepID=UPI001556FF8A|nr:hypothetical protein [Niveibacterium sp. COAC-50]
MMGLELPVISKGVNKNGCIEYHVNAVADWDGFDSLIKYLEKYWHAAVVESDDGVYSRRKVLRSGDVPITIYHDSQIGNYFLREDDSADQSLLEKIEADLVQRLSE